MALFVRNENFNSSARVHYGQTAIASNGRLYKIRNYFYLSVLKLTPHKVYYSQNTRTFPLPVLKLVMYFSNIASISETSSVILQLLQKPYDHHINIVHIHDTVV